MNDLQEIRQFWPWMRPPHVDYLGHHDYQCIRRGVHYLAHQHQAQWWVSVVNQHSRSWSEVFVDDDGHRTGGGDTIAAAMAAAGFAERNWTGYRQKRPWWRQARETHRLETGEVIDKTLLESRQRPRKGVRLGKRGRRIAFAGSLVHAWDWSRQRWNDRREVGQ